MRRIGIIGGGAAGFFAAINIKEKCPDDDVVILEKTTKVLQKVKVSGGGRCNVTNGRIKPGDLVKFYPRGGRKLYTTFSDFGTKEMREWLQDRGVETNVENDLRAFPSSNSSQTIIDLLLKLTKRLGIDIRYQTNLKTLRYENDTWHLQTSDGSCEFENIVVATGSSVKFNKELESLGLRVNSSVPSLFTFHIADARIEGLQGVAIPDVTLKVAGTKLIEIGPMLITHWGLSGPAVLKLSAWGARELSDRKYNFDLIINYLSISYEECSKALKEMAKSNPKKRLVNQPVGDLPKRFWSHLVESIRLSDRTYGGLGKQQINKLCEELTQAHFKVTGKSAFKEEFVTCGGVDLSEIDLSNFQAKRFPGLYLSGEVLDIDALTGGFNFQACWSASWAISEGLRSTK